MEIYSTSVIWMSSTIRRHCTYKCTLPTNIQRSHHMRRQESILTGWDRCAFERISTPPTLSLPLLLSYFPADVERKCAAPWKWNKWEWAVCDLTLRSTWLMMQKWHRSGFTNAVRNVHLPLYMAFKNKIHRRGRMEEIHTFWLLKLKQMNWRSSGRQLTKKMDGTYFQKKSVYIFFILHLWNIFRAAEWLSG